MKNTTGEEKFMEGITPEIEERIQYKIVRNIIDALEEQFYPPEEMIREEFIKSVEEAERRVKEGKATSFKDVDELKAFLDSLGSEE